MVKSRRIIIWACLLALIFQSPLFLFHTKNTIASELNTWFSYKGNHAHTGFFNQTTSNKLSLLWKHNFRGDYASPIHVVGKQLYFIDRSGFLCAVNREDGSEIYRKRIHEKRPFVGSDTSEKYISVLAGPIFGRRGIEDPTNLILLYDRISGEKIWEKTIDAVMVTLPIIHDEQLLFGTGKIDPTYSKTIGGSLLSLNILNGETTWETELEDYAFVLGYPLTLEGSIVLSQAIAYNRTSQSQFVPLLYAFNTETGKLLWSKKPMEEGRLFGVSSIRNGQIFLLENPGNIAIGGGGGGRGPGGGGPPGRGGRRIEAWLLKIDLQSGETLASMSIENENFGLFAPTLAHDAIYLSAFTGKVYCIDYHLDRTYWVKEYERFSFFTELTASRNYLYTVLYSGDLLCISKETGAIAFRYRIGNFGGIPVLADDQLIVSSDTLYCFSSNAQPTLLTEPTRLFVGKFNEKEKKQMAFRVIYTGLDPLEGSISSSDPWIIIKPNKITQNQQTFFVSIDQNQMQAGLFESSIQIQTNKGNKSIPIEGEFIKLPPLELSINVPESSFLVNQKLFTISGKTQALIPVWINGLELYSNRDGEFSHDILLKEGANQISIEAHSHDQRKAQLNRTIELDTIPPDIIQIQAIYNPEEEVYYVEGLTEAGASIFSDNGSGTADEYGRFLITLHEVKPGSTIRFTFTDLAQNTSIRIVHLP
jgi:outer membrane protein assembly factor BamB